MQNKSLFLILRLTILAAVFCLTACTAEQIKDLADQISGNEANFSGSYALDDGSGLTNTYISFSRGKLYEYSCSYDKFVIAENCIWFCRPGYFTLVRSQEYAIRDGILYCEGVPYGRIRITEEQMIWEGRVYRKFVGIKEERYTTISVNGELSRSVSCKGEALQIPVSVNKTIPTGKLMVQNSYSWLSCEIRGNVLYLCVERNDSWAPRSDLVFLSYPGAESIYLTIDQPNDQIPIGENFNTAATYSNSDMWFSFNADNSFVAGMIPSKAFAKYQVVWGTYKYENNKYTMFGEDTKLVWGTLCVLDDNTMNVTIGGNQPLTANNINITRPLVDNDYHRGSNRTWTPESLTIVYKALTHNSTNGVNLNAFELWAMDVRLVWEPIFASQMVIKNIILSDSRVFFLFENGQKFVGQIPSGADFSNFEMNQLSVEDTDNLSVFEGQASVGFTNGKCFIAVNGTYQENPTFAVIVLNRFIQ